MCFTSLSSSHYTELISENIIFYVTRDPSSKAVFWLLFFSSNGKQFFPSSSRNPGSRGWSEKGRACIWMEWQKGGGCRGQTLTLMECMTSVTGPYTGILRREKDRHRVEAPCFNSSSDFLPWAFGMMIIERIFHFLLPSSSFRVQLLLKQALTATKTNYLEDSSLSFSLFFLLHQFPLFLLLVVTWQDGHLFCSLVSITELFADSRNSDGWRRKTLRCWSNQCCGCRSHGSYGDKDL